MSLAQNLKREFNSATRQKGQSYFQAGRVVDVKSNDYGLTTLVQGSERNPYEVTLDWDEGEEGVLAACDCPHYEGGDFCKHIWATILAADQHGLKLPPGYHDVLVHDHDELDSWDSSMEFDGFEVVLREENAQIAGAPPRKMKWLGSDRQQPKKPASWEQRLAEWNYALRKNDETKESRTRRALFVLDVAASFQASAIILNLHQQEQRKNGEWGKAKVLKTSRGKLPGFSPEDQRRLGLVLGNYTGAHSPYTNRSALYTYYDPQISRAEVLPSLHEVLLPELCDGGSLSWALSSDQPVEDAHPCAWDAGPPWEFRLIFEDDPKKKCWLARGELVRNKQSVPLAGAVMLLSSGVVLFPASLTRFSAPEDWRWVALLRSVDQVTIPYSDREKLLCELWTNGKPEAAKLPANLQVEAQHVVPRGCLRIHSLAKPANQSHYRSTYPGYLFADFFVDYAGNQIHPEQAQKSLIANAGDQILVRDRHAEAALKEELHKKGVLAYKPTYGGDSPGNTRFKLQDLERIVGELTQEDWQVWADGRQVKRPGEFRANVVSGVDWFELKTHIDFDGQGASLPQMLKALQNNERFIILDNGTQGLLPREWIEKFAPLARFAEIDGDQIRFRSTQALLLDALLEDRAADIDIQVDRQFKRLKEKLHSFSGVKPREAPQEFQGKLRPYQKEGLGWMSFLEEFNLNGCLADDMGLGKTVQVLAWLVARLRRRQNKPTLIVAPKSVVMNWQLEAERFAPRLKVLNYTGLDRTQCAENLAKAHLVITTYGTMRNDIELLKDMPFDYVILDEAQAIKNEKSVSAKACRLLQAKHRLALTGTPVENHLGDLWSIFEFLNPGMMGRSNTLKSYGNGSTEGADVETLRRALAPFILRRTKEKVLKDLPKKSEQTLNVELLPADRKRYNDLRDYYRESLVNRASKAGMNAVRMHVLEALLRLRQVACHAGLVDKKLVSKPSAKLDLLLENIAEVVDEGHKALIFSQFTSLLTIVKKKLDKQGLCYEYLDGRTRNRQERIDHFQSDPDCPLFLISLKAGGTGLNLTAADYVFLMDPWWNPAVEKQAIDRVHRIGQKRPVFAYRLVASDTVEEKIIELQAKKRELADAIITGDKSLMAGLTLEDLRLLLS
jgi:superfamily II DNA or RNA helicase